MAGARGGDGGGGEKKIKTRRVGAVTSSARDLRGCGGSRGALTPAPIPSEDAAPASAASASGVPRCAVPRGPGPARRPGRRSQAGLGEMPNRFPSLAAAPKCKRSLLPLGERAAATKWCLSGPEPQWRDGGRRWGSGWPGPEEGAGPTGGRLRLAGLGSRWGAGQGARRPAPAHSPLTPTRAHSQLLLLPLLLQEAGGGWCIKGEAPPNRVSSPRLFPSSGGG